MKNYIDYDKVDKCLYMNYFLEDYKISVKVPVESINHPSDNVKVEGFRIDQSIYLVDF